jgi:integrase/recombinase XerD
MPSDILAPQGAHALRQFGDDDPQKLRAYLLMLASFLEGKPLNTKRTYRCGIQQFFELFDWVCPEKVTPAHVVAFKKWLLEHRGVSETTTYYRLSAVSSFFDYLCLPPSTTSDPLLRSNPFRLVPRSDIQPTPYARATAMDWDTFREILEAVPPTATGLRDKAILLFFAFTGRRRSEVASLRLRDLDLKARPRTYSVRVKGGRVKQFELPDICYDAIRAYWICADRLRHLHPNAGVFTASRDCVLTAHLDPDAPLSNRTMNDILHRYATRAGVDMEGVRVHAIRHMAARDLDRAGLPLQDIQAFLGHASPTTTQVYLDRLSGPASAHTDVLLRVREASAALARSALSGDS